MSTTTADTTLPDTSTWLSGAAEPSPSTPSGGVLAAPGVFGEVTAMLKDELAGRTLVTLPVAISAGAAVLVVASPAGRSA